MAGKDKTATAKITVSLLYVEGYAHLVSSHSSFNRVWTRWQQFFNGSQKLDTKLYPLIGWSVICILFLRTRCATILKSRTKEIRSRSCLKFRENPIVKVTYFTKKTAFSDYRMYILRSQWSWLNISCRQAFKSPLKF